MKQMKSMDQVTLDIKKRERKKDYEDKFGTWRQELNAQTFFQQAKSCLQILTSLIDSLQQPNRWKYSFQLLALSRKALEEKPKLIKQTLGHLKSYFRLSKQEMDLIKNSEKIIMLIKGIRALAISAIISKEMIRSDIIGELEYHIRIAWERKDSKLIWAAMDAIYIISSRLGTIEAESLTIRNSLERVEQDVIDFVKEYDKQIFLETRNIVSSLWWLIRPFYRRQKMPDNTLAPIKRILEGIRNLGDLQFSFVLLRLQAKLVNMILEEYPLIIDRIFLLLTASEDLLKRRAVRFMWIVSYRAERRFLENTFGMRIMHLLVSAAQTSATAYSRRTGARIIFNLLVEKLLLNEEKKFLLRSMPFFLKKGDYYEDEVGDTIWELLRLVTKDQATGILKDGLFQVIEKFYEKDHIVYRSAEKILFGRDIVVG